MTSLIAFHRTGTVRHGDWTKIFLPFYNWSDSFLQVWEWLNECMQSWYVIEVDWLRNKKKRISQNGNAGSGGVGSKSIHTHVLWKYTLQLTRRRGDRKEQRSTQRSVLQATNFDPIRMSRAEPSNTRGKYRNASDNVTLIAFHDGFVIYGTFEEIQLCCSSCRKEKKNKKHCFDNVRQL